MRITIKDVAKAAGVSVATASYALNGTGPVSQEKLQRVKEAAQTLGYVPNGIAKALQAKRNGMAGYFAYSLTGPFFGQVMRGIEDTFNATDEEIVACSCSAAKKKVTHLLSERMVDGTIVFGEHIEDSLIRRIAGPGCPVVLMDRDMVSEHISCVYIDNFQCAYDVGRYIHSLGLRTVGLIVGEGPDGKWREAGIRAAAKDLGLEIREDWVFCAHFRFDLAKEIIMERLRTQKDLPDIFFAFNDEMAIGIMDGLQQMGYEIPRDVSLIGMDDIPQSKITIPKLTTYHLPIYEHGVQAANLLLGMLHQSKPGTATRLTGYIVERESCRPKADPTKG